MDEETEHVDRMPADESDLVESHAQGAAGELTKTPKKKRQASTLSTMLEIPLARVRKTIKLDPDVKHVKKEAVVAIGKVTELFIQCLARSAIAKTKDRKGGHTIRDTDVNSAIYSYELLSFLKLDFPRKVPVKPPPRKCDAATEQAKIERPKPAPKPKPVVAVVSGDKAITKYFSAPSKAKDTTTAVKQSDSDEFHAAEVEEATVEEEDVSNNHESMDVEETEENVGQDTEEEVEQGLE